MRNWATRLYKFSLFVTCVMFGHSWYGVGDIFEDGIVYVCRNCDTLVILPKENENAGVSEVQEDAAERGDS
jgi:hypothetical protein